MGRVLFTGLVMMQRYALGQNLATPVTRSRITFAFVLKRSVCWGLSAASRDKVLVGKGRLCTISRHAGLSGNAGGDHDYIRAGEGLFETAIGREMTGDFRRGVDVVQVDGYAGCVDDVV